MSRSSIFSSFDFQLLIPVFILVLVSLTTLFSIQPEFFRNQLGYLVISLVAYVLFSQVHYKVAQLYGYQIYVISIVLLLLAIIIGIESRGATRWLDVFGIRIQFSEILKPFLAISLATYLSHHEKSFRTFFMTFLFLSPIAFIIFKQPDLGSALIYALVVAFTLMVAGFSLWWFVGGSLVSLGLIPVFWKFLHGYQKDRVLAFFNPAIDPLGTSYNALQSIIAVGSGMFLGKGMSERTQSALSFLPEHHTDFIFATISEGLGFVGSLGIIVVFGFLLYRIYAISAEADDVFCKLYASAVFGFIFTQFFINVGMNIGIVPVVGITLPFVSYGGSSLLSNFIMLGFITSVRNFSKKTDVFQIR